VDPASANHNKPNQNITSGRRAMVAVSDQATAAIAEPETGFKSWVDHFSRFTGLAVGNLYLLAAACTMYEVIARYVFHAPTQWAFEVVMVLCACAWMLSAGFVTLQKRHIGITVFYLMAPKKVQWWLDLFAMVVGVFALYMLASDTLVRAMESIDLIERAGSAFNSPLPMVLKSLMCRPALIYLAQLLVNLSRHFEARAAKLAVKIVLLGLTWSDCIIIYGPSSAKRSTSRCEQSLDRRSLFRLDRHSLRVDPSKALNIAMISARSS
jgi:TRAP-type C4-dicarboxylate transport system permease small subunit